MLIHVTRFNNLQDQIAVLVQKELQDLSARIMRDPDQDDLKIIWEDFIETSETMLSLGYKNSIPLSWEDVKSELYEAVRPIKIKTINGLAGDILDYKNVEIEAEKRIKNKEKLHWGEKGAHIIAIGGDKLSRGLTLEGLSISYYLRASRMYDTLMQMGRWFGYREWYQDLCRIYTTKDLIEWYMHIAQANIELKKEFEYMENIGSTPEHFGLKVRNHPGRLAITSASKSRQAERVSLTFSGTSRGTLLFDKKYSKNNFETLVSMINFIDRPPDNLNDGNRRGFLWNKLSPDLVTNFLRSYNYPVKDSKIFDPSNIADYIEKQIPYSELTEWSVFISSKKTDVFKTHKICEMDISCTQRTPTRKVENGRITLKGIINPPDEIIYLTKDEKKDLETEYKKLVDKKKNKEKSFKRFALEKRSKKHGLLIIYLIANNGKPTKTKPEYIDTYGIDEPVTGFLISFPKSDTAKTIEYKVNPIYFGEEED